MTEIDLDIKHEVCKRAFSRILSENMKSVPSNTIRNDIVLKNISEIIVLFMGMHVNNQTPEFWWYNDLLPDEKRQIVMSNKFFVN